MFYAGLDYSKHFSVATVINSKGEVVSKGRLANGRKAFASFFLPYRKRICIVLEAGRNWHVAVDLLEGLVSEIKLAHPLKVRAIAEAKIKTDEIDSVVLAQLLRCNLIPEAYLRTRQMRRQQLQLRLRAFWVRQRTQVRNRIHVLIDGEEEPVREAAKCYKDLFGRRGRQWLKGLQLDAEPAVALQSLLEVEEQLTQKIKQSDQLVYGLYQADDDCLRIESIPGFGIFLSVLAKVEIGDINRFKSAGHLCSYAGLVPSTYSSGGKTRHGKITKQGSKLLRWCLVEAAIHALNDRGNLKRFYLRIRRKKGTKIARTATARKLCCILYRVLKQQDSYWTFKKSSAESPCVRV